MVASDSARPQLGRRIVVVTSALNLTQHADQPQPPQLVGVVHWTSPELWNTVIVKTRVAASGALERPQTLIARRAQAQALARPIDFAPMKGDADVVWLGHVELEGKPGEPLQRTGGMLAGGETTALLFQASSPGRIPLVPPHVRIVQAPESAASLAPRPTHDAADNEFQHREDFPYEDYQCASRWLLREWIQEGSALALTIEDKTVAEFRVPSRSPRVLLDPAHSAHLIGVDMELDTVVVDVDRRELELTWRGIVTTLNDESDLDRILVGWLSDEEMADPKLGWDALLRELPHGWFEHAWMFADAEAGSAPPPLEGDELERARMQSWSHPHPPAPRLELEQFTTIQAELVEAREPRAQTLQRHGLDEYKFGLEERAWLDRIAGESRLGEGQPPIAQQYARAMTEASDRLAQPAERERTLRSYAELMVQMERSDAHKTLQQAGLSLGAWLRWDRHVTQRTSRDASAADELHAHLDELRAKANAAQAARKDGEPLEREKGS